MSWIKLDLEFDDLIVMLTAKKCNASSITVYGGLVALWKLADRMLQDSNELTGYTADDLNRKIGIENFCQSLPGKWIDLSGDWVKLPNYLESNGPTQRERELNKRRVSRYRCNAPTITKSISKRNGESVTSSISISNIDLKEKEKPKKRQPKKLVEEESPLWPGCSMLRLSEREYQLALANYSKNRWPVSWLDHAITEVDLWLCGETTAAIKARGSKTHLKQLYATWVLEKAQKRASLATTSTGRQALPMHPSHKPFIKEAPKTSAEIEAEKRAAEKMVEKFRVGVKEIA